MILIPWEERPTEIANLFNPAFCSLVMRESLISFEEERGEYIHFSLVFLILPIVLHQSTRDSLPKKLVKSMVNWCGENENIIHDFPSRAKRLVPFTKESIIFGVQKQVIAFQNSSLKAIGHLQKPSSWIEGTEPDSCLQVARLVGRWFANTGSDETIYRLWGVRP